MPSPRSNTPTGTLRLGISSPRDGSTQSLYERSEFVTSVGSRVGSRVTSPERRLMHTPGSASNAQTSLISERQMQWDRQAQNADQKQAELFHIQWNLIREQMGTFSRELVAIRAELAGLKSLEARVPAIELQLTQLVDLPSAIDTEARRRKEADDTLSAELRSISDMVAAEVRTRSHMAADKEVRERRAAGDDFSLKLQELVATLEQERTDRDHADLALRNQIAGCRQDLEVEQKERASEIAEAKRGLQACEGQVGVAVKELKELRAALDKEARARSEELSRTSTSLSREIAHLAEELQRIEARLRGEVEAETRARLAEKEHQLHVAQELSARVTELSTSLEQERVERDSGDSTLR